MPRADATARLDQHLARTTRRRARRQLPAPQVRVDAPGFAYRSGDETPFHAASVGKLVTTALVAQQLTAERLALDSPVERLLPAAELDGLFACPGGTIEQLLAHTSGVADYFGGDVIRGRPFIDEISGTPERMWEPAQLLAFSREHQRPVGTPGERFHYSDTGFVLLGRALEELTGDSFVTLARRHVLEPAGMHDSVYWLREPGPDRIAPMHVNGVDLSDARSLSCDWAGGGLVTTLDDLARLGTAFTSGHLSPSWAALAEPRNTFRRGIRYGAGVMQLRFEGFMPLLRGLGRPVGHLGVTGVHLFVDPERRTSVVLNFHDTREMVASFKTHIRIAQLLNVN